MRSRLQAILAITIFLFMALDCLAQQDINRPPINYDSTEVNDAVAQLQRKIECGKAKLYWDQSHGWLPSLMQILNVSETSQVLVFSKTSLQHYKITPQKPRAIYYNDDVYLGVVQHGDFVEISAVDSHQGAVFYSLEQKKTATPKIKREQGRCLVCHHDHRTQDVPGYLLRSVYPGTDGNALLSLGSTTSDQTTDLTDRYGGWYVTGKHGDLRHRGNLIANDESLLSLDFEKGANISDLNMLIRTSPYLSPHSDLVALMVLDHQTQMHNFITKASYEARLASHYDETWNKILDRPASFETEISKRRLIKAGDQLLRYMLFSGEFRLTSPIEGSSMFTDQFQSIGPHDSRGRSLRDFDLQTRLFKYPCSFLIYSESFDSLPSKIHDYVVRRLNKVLSGEDQSTDFLHLTSSDRTAIREILVETKPGIFD